MIKDIVIKDEENDYKFNFRVAGVFVDKEMVLLQKSKEDNYYSLIGGRVKYNETTVDALIREVQEEVGILITKEDLRLINVAENFFVYNGNHFHELLFIYRIENNIYFKNKKDLPTLDKVDVINQWHDISSLDNIDVRPTIITDSIHNSVITHNIIQ